MSSKAVFSRCEEETLVQLIERHPCIYDILSDSYKDVTLRESAWNDIAKTVGRSAEQCKWRWRNIKDTYVKRKKKGILEGSGLHKFWHLSTGLKFLDVIPFQHRNPTAKNILHLDQALEFVDVRTLSERQSQKVQSLFSTAFKLSTKNTSDNKVNRSRNSKNLGTECSADTIPEVKMEAEVDDHHMDFSDLLNGTQEDHVDVFFRSVALSVKTFPKHLVNQAKLRTLQMLVELESKCASSRRNLLADVSAFKGVTNTFDGRP